MSPGRGDDLPPAHEVAERALALAGSQDAGCVVLVEELSQAEVRFANNTTTTNGVRRDRRVTAIRFHRTAGEADGVSAGVARQGGDVDLAGLLAAAERDAAGSPPAEDAFALVAPGDPGAGTESAAFTAGPVMTDLKVLGPVVDGLAGAFGRARSQDRVLAGFAEHGVATTYLASSTGLRLRHAQPTGALHLVARSTDGTRSAWDGVGTADFTDVAVEELEARVVQRLGWAARQEPLGAGRYEVVLPPSAVADLMAMLAETCNGRDAEDGRSVFSRPGGGARVGDVLSSLPFALRSDPAEPGLACAPFLATSASSSDLSVFDNGLALPATSWIADGRLETLRYHRAGAAASGATPAAPIDNLVLEQPGATASIEEMIGRTERGLLLTCLWYIREVDPATLLLTGLTRDGVYLIEGGEVTGAVNNFRFNESPVDLLGRVTEAGRSVRTLGREFGEWYNRTTMPPLRVPDFNMSSVSQAS